MSHSHGKLAVGSPNKLSVTSILKKSFGKRSKELVSTERRSRRDEIPRRSGSAGKRSNVGELREDRRSQRRDIGRENSTNADPSTKAQAQLKTQREKATTKAARPALTRKRSSSMGDLSCLSPPLLSLEEGETLLRRSSYFHLFESQETDLCSTEL